MYIKLTKDVDPTKVYGAPETKAGRIIEVDYDLGGRLVAAGYGVKTDKPKKAKSSK